MKDTIIIMADIKTKRIFQCYRDVEDLLDNLGSAYIITPSIKGSGDRRNWTIERKGGKPVFKAKEFDMFNALSTVIRISNNMHHDQQTPKAKKAKTKKK